jgi:tryptophanyl-tRNA synthetase
MPKPVILSGVQPTGRLHIGNYLGALKNYVDLQNSGKYQCVFMVADLHSLSEDYDPRQKPGHILGVASDFLAVGLDPERSIIFQQSKVPAHTELTWIFSTLTPMGELERMTQFKDKAARQSENINAGLFMYPVLQATDILLYSPKFVPVGDDQAQHLELTRTIARKFNNRFGKTFIEPKILLTHTPRVMSLKDPKKKMSKSEPVGCIFMDDSPEVIHEKLRSAVTDSGSAIFYDPENKPAISNLLEIYAAFSNREVSEVQAEFVSTSYSAFKIALADLISNHFAEFRKKKKLLMAKPALLKKLLAAGSEQANKIADKKMKEVKKRIGIAV